MRSERLMILVAVMAVVMLAVPLVTDDAEASNSKTTTNGVIVSVIDDSLSLSAGGTASTTISQFSCAYQSMAAAVISSNSVG